MHRHRALSKTSCRSSTGVLASPWVRSWATYELDLQIHRLQSVAGCCKMMSYTRWPSLTLFWETRWSMIQQNVTGSKIQLVHQTCFSFQAPPEIVNSRCPLLASPKLDHNSNMDMEQDQARHKDTALLLERLSGWKLESTSDANHSMSWNGLGQAHLHMKIVSSCRPECNTQISSAGCRKCPGRESGPRKTEKKNRKHWTGAEDTHTHCFYTTILYCTIILLDY